MADDRRDDRARERDRAQPQRESTKYHGDKLDPVIPRGADQKDDTDDERRPAEENGLTGDRGRGAR